MNKTYDREKHRTFKLLNSKSARESNKKETKNMDLMSALDSTDYNQPNGRSASLKVKSRTQSKSINTATQMAHSDCSFIRSLNHRLSDYFNCCDNKILAKKRLRREMCRGGFLVFSVVVLINIASINCVATRQVEGEFIFFTLHIFFIIFMTLGSDLLALIARRTRISVNWNLSQMKRNI